MHGVIIFGGGELGAAVSALLVESGDYRIILGDRDSAKIKKLKDTLPHPNFTTSCLDIMDKREFEKFLSTADARSIISCLPYDCNVKAATIARTYGLNYFDLTEDLDVSQEIRRIGERAQKAFVPRCGIAPGLINIISHDLMAGFDDIDNVKMRVGALPQYPNNALKYYLTWSIEGLINEYKNLCWGIENSQRVRLLPLEGYETIVVDGIEYEAFNTSGVLTESVDSYVGKVRSMNYRTLRYPGHCEKMRFLMNDLKLKDNPARLKRILENSLPRTSQDIVIIYASVVGKKADNLIEETYVKKVYPQTIAGRKWSAIQVAAAAGVCSAIDLVLQKPEVYQGFVNQEAFAFDHILRNRFGKFFT